MRSTLFVGWIALAAAALSFAGCDGQAGKPGPFEIRQKPATTGVPEPINLLLPQSIRIHPFTGTREFGEDGGIRGIEVRIEALDAYEDSAKAFGDFRFELYAYRRDSPDHKGPQISTWQAPVWDPRANIVHWDNVHRNYLFKLQWDRPIPVGKRFLLVAVFDSPYTERLFDERVFVSGQ